MRRPTALVTGGAGFIGSHLARALLQEGYHVRVLDDLSHGRIERLPQEGKVDLRIGDARDPRAVSEAMRGVGVVFHQAAVVSVNRSVEDPAFVHDVNATVTLRLLQAAVEEKVGRFVYASSSSVYGDGAALPVSENQPTAPVSPYGASKLAGEAYCSAFWGSFGLPTVALRYFNVFGPGQDGSSAYAAVIPLFAEAFARGEAPVVFGDGEQTRDFVFVEDVAQANLRAAEAPGAAFGRAFNVATGSPRTINEVAALLGAVIGSLAEPTHGPERPGDIRHSVADVTAAREVLGFRARVSLDQGLRRSAAASAAGPAGIASGSLAGLPA